MRRLVSLSFLALAAAALGAFAVGFRAADDRSPTAGAAAHPALLVTSRHVERAGAGMPRLTIAAGALAIAPRFGVAVVQRGRDARPAVFVADAADGPLRIVEAADGSAVLRSAAGRVYALDAQTATLVPLGQRLDPDRLSIARRGVAVPIEYGPRATRRALLLVGFDRHGVPHLQGHLDGFALWRPSSPLSQLERPVLGPDGALYRIDPVAHRLERVAAPSATRRPWSPRPPSSPGKCTSWPGGAAGTYEGCPGEIHLVRPDGGRTTLTSDPDCVGSCRSMMNWERILPSPDGRTLLVQEGVYACGGQWTTSFLPATGGTPEPVVPALDFSSSWALGWLTPDTALVAAASQGEECGPRRSGIYVVDRRSPAFLQLVAATTARDATTWGR
jgi:hypothetical protein